MPTFVYAPCTDTSIGIDSICIRWTVSMIGMRQARPPNTTRDPMIVPSGSWCFRPEKIRISDGRQR